MKDKKKMIIVICILILILITVFFVKIHFQATKSSQTLQVKTNWWEISDGIAPTADTDWVLAHEIPENYIPVIGGDELYMVIDDDGNIIKYRQRIYNEESGEWEWKDVNPDIPENYEAVEGLDNVYRVTAADGSVRYYKYHRNEDDSYYFTEVDEKGNPIKADALTNDEIPKNYIRIDGTNVYAVYNEYGVLTGYKKRTRNADGSYSWVVCESPVKNTNNNSIPAGTGAIKTGSSSNSNANNGSIEIVDNYTESKNNYTETEISSDVKLENGYYVTYETTVIKTYDKNGELLSTKTNGPVEIARIPETEANLSILTENPDLTSK